MKIKLFLLGCGLGLGVATSGFAVTTGVINARLVLTTGCLVNGQPGVTNADFGTLDFGTSVATFDSLEATLSGSVGTGIFVRCTADEDFSVQVVNSNLKPATVFGNESTTGQRYLIHDSDASTGISYTLYPSAASSDPIVNGVRIDPVGNPDPINGYNYPIVGRIEGGGNNATIPIGTYLDTINVSVTY